MKTLKLLTIISIITLLFLPTEVYANTSDGDLTPEEGATEYIPTQEELEMQKEKEKIIQKDKMSRAWPGGYYGTLPVTEYEQINGYYCGPATVKQVIQYRKGSSNTQQYYANQLGTTTDGTDMSKIVPVLRSVNELGYGYQEIGTYSQWSDKIYYSIKYKYPAIMDIKTNNIGGFPYSTSGHFVNTSGLDTTSSTHKVRITDPYTPGLGNRWYNANNMYNANNNHWRKAIIW